MPKCPICEKKLQCYDIVDTELTDNNQVLNGCVGWCPKCGKSYRWIEVYEYSHVEEIQELDEPIEVELG